jgi:bacterial/archaeal transporter family-2 protein
MAPTQGEKTMRLLILAAAFMAGVFLPLQAGINAQLKNYSGSPVIAAFISFLSGTLVLAAAALALRVPWPSSSDFSNAPWWVWTGGALGACFVFLAIVLAESLGAAVMVSLIIAGQMVASLFLDHYGLVGYARHPINPARIIGTILLLAGVILIRSKGTS